MFVEGKFTRTAWRARRKAWRAEREAKKAAQENDTEIYHTEDQQQPPTQENDSEIHQTEDQSSSQQLPKVSYPTMLLLYNIFTLEVPSSSLCS